MKPTPQLRSLLLGSTLFAAVSTATTHAQTWVGGTSDWGTAGNWDPSGVPATSGNVIFTSTGAGSVYLGTAARTVSTITFNNTTTATPYTIYLRESSADSTHRILTVGNMTVAAGNHTILGIGTAAELTFTNGSTIAVAADSTLSLNARLRGSGLFKTGDGTLALTRDNGGSGSWGAGTFTVSAGTLDLAANRAAGNSANNFSVSSGATLKLSHLTAWSATAGVLTLNGTGFSGVGALYASVTSSVTTSTFVDLATDSRIGVEAGQTLTIGGNITGAGLEKSGGGILSLTSTNNTYSGGTTVSAGTLEVQGSIASSSGITNNAALVFNSASAQSYSNAIGGSGTLTKQGAGTLTLSGNNTYTGATAVSAGTLTVGSTGSLGVNDTTTRKLTVTGDGSLVVDGGTAIFRGSGGTDTAMLIGDTAVASGGNVTVQNNGSLTLSTGRFIMGGGATASASNTAATSVFSQTSGSTTIANGNTFVGNITPGSLNISGGTFTAGTFNMSVRANSTLTLSGANTVVTLGNLSFGGGGATDPVAGTTAVVNLNGGTLAASSVTVASVTNRTHTFHFDGGTLKATGASASFFSTGTNLTASVKASGGTIDNNGFAITIGQDLLTDPVSTGGGMTFKGGGTTTLTGTSTYTGATTVQQGTLALGASGTISSTLVLGTVGGGTGTLDVTAKSSFTQANVSGCGTLNIGAGKTINVSTTLAPGFSPGELEVIGNLTLEDTAITTIELAGILGVAGTDFDFVDVSGALTWDGALNIVSFGGYNIDQAATYNLFDASSFAGDFNSVSVGGTGLSLLNDSWTGTSGLYSYEFDQTNGVLTVIPEPGAALLGGLGLLALLRRRRA